MFVNVHELGFRAELLQMFPGKDLGRLDAFCGMQIHPHPSLESWLTSFPPPSPGKIL
jgi:hypothetical protein